MSRCIRHEVIFVYLVGTLCVYLTFSQPQKNSYQFCIKTKLKYVCLIFKQQLRLIQTYDKVFLIYCNLILDLTVFTIQRSFKPAIIRKLNIHFSSRLKETYFLKNMTRFSRENVICGCQVVGSDHLMITYVSHACFLALLQKCK